MVTLCDIGISINFYVGKSIINVVNAGESIADCDSADLTNIAFREFVSVEIEFISTSVGDRLYFDGIDLLPAEI